MRAVWGASVEVSSLMHAGQRLRHPIRGVRLPSRRYQRTRRAVRAEGGGTRRSAATNNGDATNDHRQSPRASRQPAANEPGRCHRRNTTGRGVDGGVTIGGQELARRVRADSVKCQGVFRRGAPLEYNRGVGTRLSGRSWCVAMLATTSAIILAPGRITAEASWTSMWSCTEMMPETW